MHQSLIANRSSNQNIVDMICIVYVFVFIQLNLSFYVIQWYIPKKRDQIKLSIEFKI